MFRYSRSLRLLAVVPVLCLIAAAQPCDGQSLHGSPASVNRMYHEARSEALHFFRTPAGVRRAVESGHLERLVPNGTFTLHDVSFPYVLPMTRTFVLRLAPQFRAACGKTLEITSAVRPTTRQPANSVPRSVHPTGMAVDLHKPRAPKCLRWLRNTLLDLENTGVLETTEEFSPPHFHVAVYPRSYTRYVAQRTQAAYTVRLASSEASTSATRPTSAPQVSTGDTYRVRSGDTLWDIARAHDTTVETLTSANDLADDVLQPGQKLVIPSPNNR